MRNPADQRSPSASEFDAMSMQSIDEYSFEVGPIRPPSEGGSHSLLLRPTRNCSWGRCKFCYGLVYDRQKLEIRSVEEVDQKKLAIVGVESILKGDNTMVIQSKLEAFLSPDQRERQAAGR